MFQRENEGAMSGNAGEAPREDFKINGQYVNTPAQGVVGIPFFDDYVEKASLDDLDCTAQAGGPFFMSINFMKVHQPNMPTPDYIGKSMSKSKFADSADSSTRVSALSWTRSRARSRQEYPSLLHDRQWRLAGRLSRCRLHADPRHQGNGAGGWQSRPCHRLDAGQDRGREEELRYLGGLDLMATFAAVAGVKLPERDRENQPIIFDSIDMSPALFGTGKSARNSWFYFTENELTPGAARVGSYKAVFNLRGDDAPANRGIGGGL